MPFIIFFRYHKSYKKVINETEKFSSGHGILLITMHFVLLLEICFQGYVVVRVKHPGNIASIVIFSMILIMTVIHHWASFKVIEKVSAISNYNTVV